MLPRSSALLVLVALSGCAGEAFVTGGGAGGTGGTGNQGGTGGSGNQGGTGGSGNQGGTGTGGTGQAGAAQGGQNQGGQNQGGQGGGAPCDPACTDGLTCCDGHCVNTANDIRNCHGCGKECNGVHPFCGDNGCTEAPCNGIACIATEFCCGTLCCPLDQLCCVVQQGGPVGGPACFAPTPEGTCPPGNPGSVCAAPDTPIATPTGERAIAELGVGDLVLSVDRGVVRAVPLVRVSRTAVERHRVVRVTLESGRVVELSPGHPTADGRLVGELRPGDALAGLGVAQAELVAYSHEHTYDVLPASDTGAYFAAGALVGSTLARDPTPAPEACLAP
ncbi:MAG: hypothetical protein IT373_16145 [Polyangiaceae bacterium]|nr:hypothetical protein [Polyangiaceae bacterium]